MAMVNLGPGAESIWVDSEIGLRLAWTKGLPRAGEQRT